MMLPTHERDEMTEDFRREIQRIELEDFPEPVPELPRWQMMAIILAACGLIFGPLYISVYWGSL